MELVYLWVEDYKNIHKQGFNFSPRFDCEYDGETLTIDENKDYIPDFFGENINVTAIVGKNGSGKSSVLFQDRNGEGGFSPHIKVLYKDNCFLIIEPYHIDNDDDGPYAKVIKINNITNIKYKLESRYKDLKFDTLDRKQYITFNPNSNSLDDEYSIYFSWDILRYDFFDNYIEESTYGSYKVSNNILFSLIYKNNECISYKHFSKKLNKKIKMFEETEYSENFFSLFNFKYNKIDLLDLSHGERSLFILTFLILDKLLSKKNYIIYLDEPDLTLHPKWQKDLIALLIKICSFYENKIHIILTTHSPFLLSDIPKQNIIFLDTYEDGKCKVLKPDEAMNKKQTFGVNIHTLLSDSFFMEDGLIGEFAKNKINEIIDFHNIVKKEKHKKCLKKIYEKREKRFRQTQSIIGEAYLKQILENHLLEIDKLLLGKNKAKEKLKERLEKQLRELDE